MSNALDIAREMARHFESGKSVEEVVAAISAAFPSATFAELQRACRVGCDQMAMWQGTVSEDVVAVVDMIANDEPEGDIKAAVERAKLKAETNFPMKCDKARS